MDGADSVTEYEYDENGNLTKDLNRNILSIQYDSLNLQSKIAMMGGTSGKQTSFSPLGLHHHCYSFFLYERRRLVTSLSIADKELTWIMCFQVCHLIRHECVCDDVRLIESV